LRIRPSSNRDHEIGVGRMLLREPVTDPAPHPVHRHAEHAAVRAREVDVLEDALAQRPLGLERAPRAHALVVHPHQLAGLDVAHVVGRHQVERARLARHHVAVLEPADA
jgi:hypothetical protein